MRNRKSIIVLLLIAVMLIVTACGSGGGNSSDHGSGTSQTDSGQTGNTESPGEGAGGQDDGEQITLRIAWWGGQERHDRTLQVIELYEELNPHIKIVPEYSGFDGYFDKLTTQFAAGNAPDIIQYGGNLEDYVRQGVVLELDPYIGKELDISKHDPDMIETGTFNGKFYGVTLGTNAFGVILNKTVFEEAGVALPPPDWTFEQYLEIAKQITDSGVSYGSMDMTDEWWAVYLAQLGKTTHIQHDDGRFEMGFTEEDALNWFKLMEQARESGGIVPPEIQVEASQTPEQSMVVMRDVAIYHAASNQLIAFNSATEDEIIIHPAPIMVENPVYGSGLSLRPSQFFAGYAKTEHPEEVARFLDFFTNNPQAIEILGNERGIQVNSEMRDHLAQFANEADRSALEFISYVSEHSSPYIPNFPGYNEN